MFANQYIKFGGYFKCDGFKSWVKIWKCVRVYVGVCVHVRVYEYVQSQGNHSVVKPD